jgi:hypothetical protein
VQGINRKNPSPPGSIGQLGIGGKQFVPDDNPQL